MKTLSVCDLASVTGGRGAKTGLAKNQELVSDCGHPIVVDRQPNGMLTLPGTNLPWQAGRECSH